MAVRLQHSLLRVRWILDEMGSTATERIRELAGIGFVSSSLDWDPNEEGWIEVRSSNVGEIRECENRDQFESLDYGDDSDLVFSDLNFYDLLDRISEQKDFFLQSNYDSDVCKTNFINKAVNSMFDQSIMFSLFLLVYLNSFVEESY
jgi:hypothetical protein